MLRRATPERLSMFSDGVFAVLITVLVLELRPPERHTFDALLALWPTWLSYAVSYLFIAIVWTNHHYLMRYASEATPNLLWFNFAHLFSMSLSFVLHRLDGSERARAATGSLLRGGLLSSERDLYRADLGAYRSDARLGNLAKGPPGHACAVGDDTVPLRRGRSSGAKVPACRPWNLHLLPHRLSETRTALASKAERWNRAEVAAFNISPVCGEFHPATVFSFSTAAHDDLEGVIRQSPQRLRFVQHFRMRDESLQIQCAKKSRISAAISLTWVSSAKWPVSKKWTMAPGISRLNASAPRGRKNGSFFPQTARKRGL